MSAPFNLDYFGLLHCELCDTLAPSAYCEACDSNEHCGYCGVYEDCAETLEV